MFKQAIHNKKLTWVVELTPRRWKALEVEMLPASSLGVDAVCDGWYVEIKATQGIRVALRSCPEHLLVLKLDRHGGFKEAYNGPGELVWKELADKPQPSNGQYQVS